MEVPMETLNRTRSFEQRHSDSSFEQIIGSSPALKLVLADVERVAPTDATVLVLGETGTGKELIAQAIHNASARRGRPFIKLNCAAIPFDLLESELFGYEKGAFTGAFAQKMGRFEMADTGTLFLDEIGDIPLALQPKLLRVLQEQEFERLGSGKTNRVNVRLVAATHRDPAEMVRRNEFRSDLYYRLNVFPVVLPSLRERRQDIGLLVSHFVEMFGQRMGKHIDQIPKETLDALTSYSWPGNVRELQNLIERAVILSNNGVLPNPLPTSDKNPLTVTPSQGTFNDSTRALILVRGIAGGRLGYRRIRWRCRPAGTEADHFNCQDEEARNLPAGTPERYDSTPGYACRVSNGRDQHLSVISTLIAVSPSALKHAQEIATSFSEL
jgi:formate hydrogenlyase transcriptional activator